MEEIRALHAPMRGIHGYTDQQMKKMIENGTCPWVRGADRAEPWDVDDIWPSPLVCSMCELDRELGSIIVQYFRRRMDEALRRNTPLVPNASHAEKYRGMRVLLFDAEQKQLVQRTLMTKFFPCHR